MNPVSKAPPGKLAALKAMLQGGGGPPSAPAAEGDVLGPEASDDGAAAPQGPAGGDVEAQMNDVMSNLESACSGLEGITPDDEQDSATIQEAKAYLDHAKKLIMSTAHQESAESPSNKEPTEQGQGGEINQKDAEL